MDAVHFDALSTRLAGSLTRRHHLGMLGLLGLGAALTPGSAEGKKKKKKKPCPPCVGRKKGKCKKRLADGTLCDGGTCQGGTCTPSACPSQRVCGPGCCPEGKVCGSNGACVDPTCCSDNAVCGNISTAGKLCCVAPQVAYCCCEHPAGAQNGYMLCCDPNTSGCPFCTSGSAQAGTNGTIPGPNGVCPYTPHNIVSQCT